LIDPTARMDLSLSHFSSRISHISQNINNIPPSKILSDWMPNELTTTLLHTFPFLY
jgi:hypothetical protein